MQCPPLLVGFWLLYFLDYQEKDIIKEGKCQALFSCPKPLISLDNQLAFAFALSCEVACFLQAPIQSPNYVA